MDGDQRHLVDPSMIQESTLNPGNRLISGAGYSRTRRIRQKLHHFMELKKEAVAGTNLGDQFVRADSRYGSC